MCSPACITSNCCAMWLHKCYTAAVYLLECRIASHSILTHDYIVSITVSKHSVIPLARHTPWIPQTLTFAHNGWPKGADSIPYRHRRIRTTAHGGRAREAAWTDLTLRAARTTNSIFAFTQVKRKQEACQTPSPEFLLRTGVSRHPDYILDIHSIQESIPECAHDSTWDPVSPP